MFSLILCIFLRDQRPRSNHTHDCKQKSWQTRGQSQSGSLQGATRGAFRKANIIPPASSLPMDCFSHCIWDSIFRNVFEDPLEPAIDWLFCWYLVPYVLQCWPAVLGSPTTSPNTTSSLDLIPFTSRLHVSSHHFLFFQIHGTEITFTASPRLVFSCAELLLLCGHLYFCKNLLDLLQLHLPLRVSYLCLRMSLSSHCFWLPCFWLPLGGNGGGCPCSCGGGCPGGRQVATLCQDVWWSFWEGRADCGEGEHAFSKVNPTLSKANGPGMDNRTTPNGRTNWRARATNERQLSASGHERPGATVLGLSKNEKPKSVPKPGNRQPRERWRALGNFEPVENPENTEVTPKTV